MQQQETVQHVGNVAEEVRGKLRQSQENRRVERGSLRSELGKGVIDPMGSADFGGSGWNRERMGSAPAYGSAANVDWGASTQETSENLGVGIGLGSDRRSSAAPICASISKPPAFSSDSYEGYKRNFRWRAELRAGISESRTLAAIGVSETAMRKWY